jgi:hypothetical protein
MQPAPVGDEQIRALAAEILRHEPYAGWRQGERALSWLKAFLDWFDRWNDWVAGLPPWTQVALFAGLLGLSLLLLAHIVWSVAVALRANGPAAEPPAEDVAPSFVDEAAALAAQGRFLDAAHRLQLASIALLVSQRRLTLSRFEANRVLRRRIGEASLPAPERRALVELVDRLERGWFRDRHGDAALYDAWRALHARLAAGVPAA